MHELQSLRVISAQDLALLGLNDVAYVKPVTEDGQHKISIHAADGTQIAVMENRDVAFAAIRQNDMEPVSAH